MREKILHWPEKTRSIEVYLSTVIFGFGLILTLPGETLAHPAYSVMMGYVRVFPGNELAFGITLMLIGAIRWGAVIVNGWWHPNAVIRLAGCIVGSFFWMTLTLTFIRADIEYLPAMLAFVLPALVLETFSAMRCAQDAYEQNSLGLRERRRVRIDGRYQ